MSFSSTCSDINSYSDSNITSGCNSGNSSGSTTSTSGVSISSHL